jgi:phosphinothricin acetyltransferase
VYVDPACMGQGAGRALLVALIAACTPLGYRQMVAVIGGSDNAASIGLHAALGFERVGCLTAVGRKFDRWVDTVLMQRALGPGGATVPR